MCPETSLRGYNAISNTSARSTRLLRRRSVLPNKSPILTWTWSLEASSKRSRSTAFMYRLKIVLNIELQKYFGILLAREQTDCHY